MLSNLWKQLYPGVLRGSVMSGITRSQETNPVPNVSVPVKTIPQLYQMNQGHIRTPIDKMIANVFDKFNIKMIITNR